MTGVCPQDPAVWAGLVGILVSAPLHSTVAWHGVARRWGGLQLGSLLSPGRRGEERREGKWEREGQKREGVRGSPCPQQLPCSPKLPAAFPPCKDRLPSGKAPGHSVESFVASLLWQNGGERDPASCPGPAPLRLLTPSPTASSPASPKQARCSLLLASRVCKGVPTRVRPAACL